MCYTGGGGGYEIGGGGGSGGGGSSPSSCELLNFEAALASPDPELLRKVRVEWALRVEVRDVGASKVAVVVSNDGVVGSITSPQAVQLIDCLGEGHTYYAQVLEIRGGLCRVRIRHS